MPKLLKLTPKYCKHRASGQAVVCLDGTDHYLGPHGSLASVKEYDRLIAEWLANGRTLHASGEISVSELILAFMHFAEGYYRRPDGAPTGEVANLKSPMRLLKELCGRTRAADFGPLRLEGCRMQMIAKGWCRGTINKRIGRIKSMFRWAVSKELIPADVHHGLTALAGLKAGRSEAIEADPIRPVAAELVEAIFPHLSKQVVAMIRLQQLTGARPGEICIMRPADIDRSGEQWAFNPIQHKTAHRGAERTIYLGARAQAILLPFLLRHPEAYCFSPADADADRRAELHERRTTPPSRGNVTGSHVAASPRTHPGGKYSVRTYRQAIARGCDATFPPPAALARLRIKGKRGTRFENLQDYERRLGPDEWKKLVAWRSGHHFHPHQIRHTFATEVRERHGVEAAQFLLGHKTVTATQIYAERSKNAARQIIGEIG